MFLVLIIVVIFIIWFLSDKKKEVDKISSQGGIYLKYKQLVDHFLKIPNIKIEKKNKSSMILAVKDPYVITRFTIIHGFENVSFFWYHKSLTYGEHNLNWDFPESLPQSQMITNIENEMEIYIRNYLGDGF